MTEHTDRIERIREKAHETFKTRGVPDGWSMNALLGGVQEWATAALTYDDSDVERVARALHQRSNADRIPWELLHDETQDEFQWNAEAVFQVAGMVRAEQ